MKIKQKIAVFLTAFLLITTVNVKAETGENQAQTNSNLNAKTEEVLIVDPILKQVINKTLGIYHGDNPTKEQLATITRLSITSGKSFTDYLEIKDFSGIEYLTNLNELDVRYTIIQETALAELAKLSNLEHMLFQGVIFTHDDSTHTLPLPGGATINDEMTSSVNLDLEIDFSPLGQLRKLKTLELTLVNSQNMGNYQTAARIKANFSGLKSLTSLTELRFNSISEADDESFDFIKGLINLETLSITDSPALKRVESIASLPNLKALNIENTKVLDYTPILNKDYFKNTSLGQQKADFEGYLQDVKDGSGNDRKLLVIDTGIKVGDKVSDINFFYLNGFANAFNIHDNYFKDGSFVMELYVNDMYLYKTFNYESGNYDKENIGFPLALKFFLEDGRSIYYNQVLINIGKVVSFDDNYEGGSVNLVNVPGNMLITKPTDPVRTGYRFIGWYEEPETINQFDFNTMVHRNITLYAKWEAKDPATIMVEHQDLKGNVLKTEIIRGYVGDEYETQSENIENYTLVETPTNDKGIFTDETITVIYKYDKNKASVIVSYQDIDGTKLAEDVILTGYVDEVYQSEAIQIDGYHLTQEPINKQGFFGDNDMVVYVYEKTIVGHDEPQESLPTTGVNAQMNMYVALLSLAILVPVSVLKIRKKKHTA